IRDFHVTGVQTCALPIFDSRAGVEGRKADADPRHGAGSPVDAGRMPVCRSVPQEDAGVRPASADARAPSRPFRPLLALRSGGEYGCLSRCAPTLFWKCETFASIFPSMAGSSGARSLM